MCKGCLTNVFYSTHDLLSEKCDYRIFGQEFCIMWLANMSGTLGLVDMVLWRKTGIKNGFQRALQHMEDSKRSFMMHAGWKIYPSISLSGRHFSSAIAFQTTKRLLSNFGKCQVHILSYLLLNFCFIDQPQTWSPSITTYLCMPQSASASNHQCTMLGPCWQGWIITST